MDNRTGVQPLKARTAARTIRARLALALALLVGSCGGPWRKGEPWSFALTRDILDRHPNQPGYRDSDREDASGIDSRSSSSFHGGVEELWILAIFCLPTAIDFVLLPVTGVHDFCIG